MEQKYKVEDKVRIKSIDWYNENKDDYGYVWCTEFLFTPEHSKYCGRELTISHITEFEIPSYVMESNGHDWTDEMIEGLVEEEGKETSWKPSKEEMDVLYSLAYITNKYDEHKEEVITRLYQDLKREFFNGSSYENMFPNTENDVRRRSTIQVLEYARSLDNYNQYGKADIDKNIAWLEKQGKSALEARIDNELVEEEVGLVDNLSSRWVNEFNLPEDYIFKDENGNVINATKIVLEKKPDDKLKLESTKKVREYWSEYARIYIEIYDNEPNECVLTHLYTLEGHRQKGYGRQALIEAESIAKELGCHTAYLKVETNSWMHEWYLRMGYKWYKTADKEYTWLVKNLTSIEEKKKEYPKTYEECKGILEITTPMVRPDYNGDLIVALQKLLICRDAYWKISGDEMGLDGPWEPDWKNDEQFKYIITCRRGCIIKDTYTAKDVILAFPTKEMRDAFYENFKELIESVKELL